MGAITSERCAASDWNRWAAYVGIRSWAERRRIEAHPRTGAIQIVEVRERVEDFVTAPVAPLSKVEPIAAKRVLPFQALMADVRIPT